MLANGISSEQLSADLTACASSVDLARDSAATMWANDNASRSLGMEIMDVAPGRARLEMTVTGQMTNGYGMCHGGFVFTLADSAFAYACNSHGEKVVAAQGSITFLRPAALGDRLVAVAQERARLKRSGLYDVSVARIGGEVIAEFRGHSRVIGKRA